MALPASGPLSLGDVNVELALTRTTTIHMGATGVRTLYNVPTGAIRLAADGYGKANRVPLNYVFSANVTQTTITMSSIVGYNAGKSDLTITVNPNVIVSSTSTATPAIAITGAAAGDTITLVNNGYIYGKGGAGGAGGGYNTSGGAGGAGSIGGPAITLTALTGIPFIVQNNGVIAGGSGGGGGGGVAEGYYFGFYYGFIAITMGGGGGGGGIITGAGGVRGTGSGTGSGRAGLPGAGTPPAYTAGLGQDGFDNSSFRLNPGIGGNGGRLGTAGFNGVAGTASGGYAAAGGVGGLAGRAVTLNGSVYTAAVTASALSSVVIGAGGTFTCAATTLRFGQKITVTGTNTGTGSITGYVSGTVYYVITTNGSTTFTLSTLWNGTDVASTAGTPIGLTFTKDGTTAGAIA